VKDNPIRKVPSGARSFSFSGRVHVHRTWGFVCPICSLVQSAPTRKRAKDALHKHAIKHHPAGPG
jgi:hypothetical protein